MKACRLIAHYGFIKGNSGQNLLIRLFSNHKNAVAIALPETRYHSPHSERHPFSYNNYDNTPNVWSLSMPWFLPEDEASPCNPWLASLDPRPMKACNPFCSRAHMSVLLSGWVTDEVGSEATVGRSGLFGGTEGWLCCRVWAYFRAAAAAIFILFFIAWTSSLSATCDRRDGICFAVFSERKKVNGGRRSCHGYQHVVVLGCNTYREQRNSILK